MAIFPLAYKHIVMDNRQTRITDLSDSEFISFLYSERDRENSLCQYHGWSDWALIGAILTILGIIYTNLKNAVHIDWVQSLYYATGSIAFFLAYHTWLRLFKRERGHDFSRVRLLKEMTPWADAALSSLTAITAIVVFIIKDGLSSVPFTWIIILALQVVAVTVALVFRNRVVPFYFFRPFFPRLWWNIIFDVLVGGLFGSVGSLSFNKASWCLLNPEFENGICIGAIAVLLYFIIKLRVENRVVEQFDAIVDMYLYTDVSKEETFQKILCNRMGYGVMEICQKEMMRVREATVTCEQKTKELEEIKTRIQNEQYDIKQIPTYHRQLKEVLNYLKDAVKQSGKLTSRLDEMVKIAPALNQVTAIKTVLKANHDLYLKVNAAQKELDYAADLVNSEFDKYYCQKSNTLCSTFDCEYRNDPMDKKYARELRMRRLLTKLHLKK